MPIDIKLDGFAELEKALGEMTVPTQKKIMRKALRKGGEPLLNKIQSDVESRWGDESGVLRRSVKMRTNFPTKRRGVADGYVNIGVFRIKSLEPMGEAHYGRTYIGAANLAYWFEKGVQSHSLYKKSRARRGDRHAKYQTLGGQHPGIAAQPIMRQDFDAYQDKLLDGVKDVMGAEIEKAWKKRK